MRYIHGNHTCKNVIEIQYEACAQEHIVSSGITMYVNEKGNKNLQDT